MARRDHRGIWQPVKLIATDEVFVKDVFILPKIADNAAMFNMDLEFYLNGKPIYLKATFFEGLYPVKLAYPDSRDMAIREIQLAKEAGVNMIRPWHKPLPPNDAGKAWTNTDQSRHRLLGKERSLLPNLALHLL